jgi:hypothetical protein
MRIQVHRSACESVIQIVMIFKLYFESLIMHYRSDEKPFFTKYKATLKQIIRLFTSCTEECVLKLSEIINKGAIQGNIIIRL